MKKKRKNETNWTYLIRKILKKQKVQWNAKMLKQQQKILYKCAKIYKILNKNNINTTGAKG